MSDDQSSTSWLYAGGTDAGEIARRYDEWAADYDADITGWSYEAPEVVAQIVVERVPDAASILDAGCGTGLVGTALRAAGASGQIVGIDVSEASLEIARATGAYRSVAPADLQEPLDFADDLFDVLVCVGVMTYVPDVEAAWREFARVVRPGGLVVVTQREDLWGDRRCAEVIDALAGEGVWSAEVTGPRPYLPGNAEGMADVGVHYVTAVVGST